MTYGNEGTSIPLNHFPSISERGQCGSWSACDQVGDDVVPSAWKAALLHSHSASDITLSDLVLQWLTDLVMEK